MLTDWLTNNCHYEIDKAIIQISLHREIQGFCFYALFVKQIIDSNRSTLAFCI